MSKILVGTSKKYDMEKEFFTDIIEDEAQLHNVHSSCETLSVAGTCSSISST